MKKIKVSSGVYWVEVPEADVYLLCGCPADSVKHLIKKGLIISDGEDSGFYYETGPNAILLSDIPIQRELFTNMSEFPVLQMLYRQGMLIPGHPRNDGTKPLLIGSKKEIEAQTGYIFRGNYGLTSIEELMEAGLDRKKAECMMAIKLKFAFGNMRSTEELIDTLILDEGSHEIRNGVFIKRVSLNLFEITHKDESVRVNLNLKPDEEYESPYMLGYHEISREYFSVVHTGEGNGWDACRPCMGSIITFQGKIYLIDAGPNIFYILESLGIGVNEIEGIFHTHSHDDHFSGMVALMRSDHRIKYYASKPVRLSVIKKLSRLTSMDESEFDKYYEVHDMESDVWNDIHGLEVKFSYSPHPVETNILFFRTLWVDGFKIYAHLADIASFNVLEKMISDENDPNGVSREFVEKIKGLYLKAVHLKKIDAGGGMIHGNPEDFVTDKSEKIIFSHKNTPLTPKQKEIGDNTFFGVEDVLIPSQQDYTKRFAHNYLNEYFEGVPQHEINMILNCPVKSYNPGSILVKRGDKSKSVLIVLSGIVEYVNHELGLYNKLTVGTIVCEMPALWDYEVNRTIRAVSYVKVIEVPSDFYVQFLKRNDILNKIKDISDITSFLQNTSLFGERVSSPQHNRIAHSMKRKTYKAGTYIYPEGEKGLFLLLDGDVTIMLREKTIESLRRGDFFGEDLYVEKSGYVFQYLVKKDATVYIVPFDQIENIPIIQCKLLESHQRRIGLSDIMHQLL